MVSLACYLTTRWENALFLFYISALEFSFRVKNILWLLVGTFRLRRTKPFATLSIYGFNEMLLKVFDPSFRLNEILHFLSTFVLPTYLKYLCNHSFPEGQTVLITTSEFGVSDGFCLSQLLST